MLPTLFGIGANIGLGAMNNYWAGERAKEDREENYRYGELAAQNADMRTRALYNDFYSPEALMRQYKEAGMSPGMLLHGTPGQGGMSGASATGAASVQTPFMPMSMLEGAQIKNIMAQTEKTKAETQNINKDTELKEIERIMSEMTKNLKTVEFDIATTMVEMNDGSRESMYEIASRHNNYEDFLQELRDVGNEKFTNYAATEAGQKELRKIYLNAQRFETDINILSAEEISAKFQKNVLETLNKKGFANQNAETCIKQLKAAGETADLTTQQKGAWNNLLEKLEKKNSTAKDIMIVAGMILSNYMHGSGLQVNTGDNYFVKR